MLKVGVDVGGTFTDTFGKHGNAVFVGKSLTTPDDLSRGIIEAIEASGLKIEDIDVLVHGSTIATNALIQRSYYGWWPRTVFVSSEGFRDTLEIRRGRNQLYGQIDMYGVAPQPLIERRYRLTVSEKVGADGRVVKAQQSRDTLHHYGTLIHTDARLNRGTSGGALLNLRGEMIGLTTSLSALTAS